MVSRRQFCERAGCVAAGLGGFGPALLTGAAADARTLDDVRERLMAALPSRRHAASIGKARLAAIDERVDPQELVKRTVDALNLSSEDCRRCSSADLRAALKAATASDFAANRTTRLGGWVFGMTEMHLFCLAALAPA